MLPTKEIRPHYPALDGLRGIAILLVLLYHTFDGTTFFLFGQYGVDLFFVLSGFLITDILLHTREKPNYLKNFYARRILRIFPLYYGVIILFFIVAPHLLRIATQYQYYHDHQAFLWTNTQNWLYIVHRHHDAQMPLFHFWSLSVEEQFYLVWPLVVLLIKNTRHLAAAVIVAMVACILSRLLVWILFSDSDLVYLVQTITRIDALCVGCLIAIWKSSSPTKLGRNITALALTIFVTHAILFACTKIFMPAFPHFRILGYTSIAAACGLALYISSASDGKWKGVFLENKLIRELGKISYGLYVYHWIFLVIFRLYFANPQNYVSVSLAAIAISLVVSWLSYYLFESRVLRLKKYFY